MFGRDLHIIASHKIAVPPAARTERRKMLRRPARAGRGGGKEVTLMNAIIMAGGEGTRLKSVTGDTPKPMALLNGRPVLEHILNLLKRNGIKNACLTLRYRPEAIRAYFGDGARFGMRLSYHEETEPLGTAGGVRACRDFYGDRDFLVISGDCACDFDLRQLMEAHHRHRPAVTMALHVHETPLSYGTVLTDRQGRVVSFIEKPAWERVVSDLVNTGIYLISPAAMELVPEGRPYDFAKDLFPALLASGRQILGLPLEGYWCDIGTPRAYYQCNLDALDGALRLESTEAAQPEAPKPAETETPRPASGVTVVEYRCQGRARLMRELSRHLMEAGADFDPSDGLALRGGAGEGGKVHIAPAADREAVVISADDPRTANDYVNLIKKLDG